MADNTQATALKARNTAHLLRGPPQPPYKGRIRNIRKYMPMIKEHGLQDAFMEYKTQRLEKGGVDQKFRSWLYGKVKDVKKSAVSSDNNES